MPEDPVFLAFEDLDLAELLLELDDDLLLFELLELLFEEDVLLERELELVVFFLGGLGDLRLLDPDDPPPDFFTLIVAQTLACLLPASGQS